MITFKTLDRAADCHFHIMDKNTPTIPNAAVRNMTATVAQYRAFATERGTTRGFVVQPSLYGMDKGHTMNAVRALGVGYRAVAVIDDRTTPNSLRDLDTGGARGARFNQVQTGATKMTMMPAVARAIAEFGWHIQLHMKASELVAHAESFADLPVPLVIDHCGRVDPNDATRKGLDAILRLLGKGRTWIKLSAPYLNTASTESNYDDAISVGRRIVEENEDRVLWRSDWPHVTETEHAPAPDGLSAFLVACLGSDSRVRKVLVDNPAVLYGF